MPANTKRSRLTIDVSPELRRRVKTAATQKDLSLSEYVSHILEAAVPGDQHVTTEPDGIVTAEKLQRLNEIRKAVMRGRKFEDDSTDIINEARAERMAEL